MPENSRITTLKFYISESKLDIQINIPHLLLETISFNYSFFNISVIVMCTQNKIQGDSRFCNSLLPRQYLVWPNISKFDKPNTLILCQAEFPKTEQFDIGLTEYSVVWPNRPNKYQIVTEYSVHP